MYGLTISYVYDKKRWKIWNNECISYYMLETKGNIRRECSHSCCLYMGINPGAFSQISDAAKIYRHDNSIIITDDNDTIFAMKVVNDKVMGLGQFVFNDNRYVTYGKIHGHIWDDNDL